MRKGQAVTLGGWLGVSMISARVAIAPSLRYSCLVRLRRTASYSWIGLLSPASENLKEPGPQSFRKGSIVISLSNKIDHCMVFSLHVFEYTLVYDGAETARRTLTIA